MRIIAAVVLATTLVASTAFAATEAPLAAGKPAGVKKAQMEGNTTLWVLGLAIVAGGAALVASDNGNTVVTTTTTTP
jgi:hypothetical protein